MKKMSFSCVVVIAGLFLSIGSAHAGRACRTYDSPGSNSGVSKVTNPNDPYFGRYVYSSNVWGVGDDCDANPTKAVTDFYVPYFQDMGIAFDRTFFGSFSSYTVEPDTHFKLGGSELHFIFNSSRVGSVAQYVQFIANFDGVKAPYGSDFIDPSGLRSSILGDPLIPGSPQTVAALNAVSSVPEPGSLAIFLLGLGLVFRASGKRLVRQVA